MISIATTKFPWKFPEISPISHDVRWLFHAPAVLDIDRYHVSEQSNTLMAPQPKQSKSGIDRYSIPLWPGIQYHFGPGAETGPDRPSRALEPSDRHLHTPKQPFNFKFHLFFCRIRPSPAVSGRFRPYSYLRFPEHWTSLMQGDTAEYGPARAQKNQTGKWYPQIPVDHTTLQINQRVVNTTLIPVSCQH